MRTGLPLWLVTFVAFGFAACSKAAGPLQTCSDDSACGAGATCVGKTCLPRGTGERLWAVELGPKPEASFALTELPAITWSGGVEELVLDRKITVEGAIEPSNGALIGRATVIASVPSSIGGRPNLSFDAEASSSTGDEPGRFVLNIPETHRGQKADFRIQPGAPGDRLWPPFLRFDVPLDDGSLTFALPKAEDVVTLDGTLTDPFEMPVLAFFSRALRNGRPISNTAYTGELGHFSLKLFDDREIKDNGIPGVVFEFFGLEENLEPRLVTDPLTVTKATVIGAVQLPPYPQPDYFRFPVVGPDPSDPSGRTMVGIAGATVRFRTEIRGATGVAGIRAIYQRQVVTDGEGIAEVALVPGIASTTQDYEVTVLPARKALFSARCVARLPVAGGGPPEAPRIGSRIELGPQARITGRVLRSDGAPAAGVTIEATAISPPVASFTACGGDVRPQGANAATDKTGSYELDLDPGTYDLGYEPSPGLPLPAFAEEGVTVTGDDTRDVQLPPGAVIDGRVLDAPGGLSVGATDVRVFELGSGKAILRGRGQSGSDGRFRIVVAM